MGAENGTTDQATPPMVTVIVAEVSAQATHPDGAVLPDCDDPARTEDEETPA